MVPPLKMAAIMEWLKNGTPPRKMPDPAFTVN
jgi:hypothetical protein